jgi:L-lysine 2,3-aminomutase
MTEFVIVKTGPFCTSPRRAFVASEVREVIESIVGREEVCQVVLAGGERFAVHETFSKLMDRINELRSEVWNAQH